jgi:vacuolar iron transporter family protein
VRAAAGLSTQAHPAASLLAFSLGALVPLFPYLVGAPLHGASLALTTVALVSGGMVVSRPVLRSGLRQLALGGWPSR